MQKYDLKTGKPKKNKSNTLNEAYQVCIDWKLKVWFKIENWKFKTEVKKTD